MKKLYHIKVLATSNHQRQHERIINRNDIKLNDVLVSGKQLKYFNSLKQRHKVSIFKNQNINTHQFPGIPLQQDKDQVIFKNAAIRTRLKSLELIQQKETITPHKTYHTSFYNRSPKSIKYNHQKCLTDCQGKFIQVANVHKMYYSLLNKELKLNASTDKTNPSLTKNSLLKYTRFSKIIQSSKISTSKKTYIQLLPKRKVRQHFSNKIKVQKKMQLQLVSNDIRCSSKAVNHRQWMTSSRYHQNKHLNKQFFISYPKDQSSSNHESISYHHHKSNPQDSHTQCNPRDTQHNCYINNQDSSDLVSIVL